MATTSSIVTPRTPPAREAVAPATDARLTSRVRLAGAAVTLLLGALHAYANRHLINPDGIAYLDVAAAYARGDWAQAVNAYWSPLYSWLLAAVFAVVEPATYWECAAAHALNVGVLLVAVLAFEWLLGELLAHRAIQRERLREGWHDLLPDWLVVGVGYAVFTLVTRRLVTVSLLTPDMLVVAGVCASAALLMRLRRRDSVGGASLLGGVLGLAYLAKTVMFPLGLVFLGLALLTVGRRAFLIACGCFALIAGPWVLVLTSTVGRVTFGESGRLNYLWNIQGEAQVERLARDPRGETGPRLLGDRPLVVDLSHCGPGYYPLWRDPSRFYRGIDARLDLRGQLRASGKVLGFYYTLFAERLLAGSLAVLTLAGFAFFARRETAFGWLRQSLRDAWAYAAVLGPAAAGLGVYLLVGHAEGRLVGPFVVLGCLGTLALLHVPHPRAATVRPFGTALLFALGLVVLSNLAFDAGKAAMAGEVEPPHVRVARALQAAGVEPGDGVASVGFTYNAYWSRLGGYRCVAEVPHGDTARFWTAAPSVRTQALTAMAAVGARAVVCDNVPADAPGWQRIAGTTYGWRALGTADRSELLD